MRRRAPSWLSFRFSFATHHCARAAASIASRGEGGGRWGPPAKKVNVEDIWPFPCSIRSSWARSTRRTASSWRRSPAAAPDRPSCRRSEEHTSELQSLMRISYAVFCLKKKKKENTVTTEQINRDRRIMQISQK